MKHVFRATGRHGSSTLLVYDEDQHAVFVVVDRGPQLGERYLAAGYLGYEHAKNALARLFKVSEDDETAALEEQLNGKGHEHGEE